MLHGLAVVTTKELRQAARNPKMLFMLFLLPLVELLVLCSALDFDVGSVPVAVCDLDRSAQSRRLTAAVTAERTLRLLAMDATPRDVEARLSRGEAQLAVVIPVGFGRGLARGAPEAVQLLVDGVDPVRARVVSSTASQRVDAFVASAIHAGAAAVPSPGARLAVVPRVLYNSRLRSAVFMVPGLAAFELLIVTMIATAMGIARERESGTLDQLRVSPLPPGVLLAGKCVPFVAAGLLVVAGILALGTWTFDVPLRGSMALVLLASGLFMQTTLGIGALIGSVAQTQQQAVLGGFLFMMPSALLSGLFTPVENMAPSVRWLSAINPTRHFVDLLRGVVLKGAGRDGLLPAARGAAGGRDCRVARGSGELPVARRLRAPGSLLGRAQVGELEAGHPHGGEVQGSHLGQREGRAPAWQNVSGEDHHRFRAGEGGGHRRRYRVGRRAALREPSTEGGEVIGREDLGEPAREPTGGERRSQHRAEPAHG